MNKEEYDKLNLYEKIRFDIDMELYRKHNHHIAHINDFLGETYGYQDLLYAEKYRLEDEIKLYKKALKEKCDVIDKAIDYIERNKTKLYQGRNDFTCEIQYSDEAVKANELLDILRGEDENNSI